MLQVDKLLLQHNPKTKPSVEDANKIGSSEEP